MSMFLTTKIEISVWTRVCQIKGSRLPSIHITGNSRPAVQCVLGVNESTSPVKEVHFSS